MMLNAYDLKDYDFSERDYGRLTAHEQEIYITQYATPAQLEQIVKVDRNSGTYAMVAARGENGANRIIARSPITNTSTLARIYYETGDALTMRGLAANENTPEFVLSELVKPAFGDKMSNIYAWRNPSLSPDDKTPENNPMGRD